MGDNRSLAVCLSNQKLITFFDGSRFISTSVARYCSVFSFNCLIQATSSLSVPAYVLRVGFDFFAFHPNTDLDRLLPDELPLGVCSILRNSTRVTITSLVSNKISLRQKVSSVTNLFPLITLRLLTDQNTIV